MTETEFTREWEAVNPKVRSMLLAIRVPRQEVDDLIQETAFRLWRARLTWDGRAFRNWALRTAARLYYDWLRARKRRVVTSSYDNPLTAPQGLESFDWPDANADEPFGGMPWPKWFDQLRERDQAMFCAIADGEDYAEMAEAFGVPIGTMRSQLHRARARAKELARKRI